VSQNISSHCSVLQARAEWDMPGLSEYPSFVQTFTDPILGELWLPIYIVSPLHMLEVLKAFGVKTEQLSDQEIEERRQLIYAIGDMAIRFRTAEANTLPMNFTEADVQLNRLETAVINLLTQWKNTATLHPALLKAMILSARRREPPIPLKQRRSFIRWSKIDAGTVLNNLLPVIRALKDPEIYHRAFSQPAGRKENERALLWEPLLDLLADFGIEKPDEHQALMVSVRALHLTIGIKPPNSDAVKKTVFDWRHEHYADPENKG
jgi:hypothetical protein